MADEKDGRRRRPHRTRSHETDSNDEQARRQYAAADQDHQVAAIAQPADRGDAEP